MTNQYLKKVHNKIKCYEFDKSVQYSKLEYKSNGMEKLEANIDNIDCDGVNTRLDIDGWLNQYITPKTIVGKYETNFYRLKYVFDKTTTKTY